MSSDTKTNDLLKLIVIEELLPEFSRSIQVEERGGCNARVHEGGEKCTDMHGDTFRTSEGQARNRRGRTCKKSRGSKKQHAQKLKMFILAIDPVCLGN